MTTNKRHTILAALAHEGATTDDLITRTGLSRNEIHDNVRAAVKELLVKRGKDDVTGLPYYTLTPAGRQRLAEGPQRGRRPAQTEASNTPAGSGSKTPADSHRESGVAGSPRTAPPPEGESPTKPPKLDKTPVEAGSGEAPADKACCNAARVVATTAGQEVSALRQKLVAAETTIAAWNKLAAEYECKSIPDLRVLLESFGNRINNLKRALQTSDDALLIAQKRIAELESNRTLPLEPGASSSVIGYTIAEIPTDDLGIVTENITHARNRAAVKTLETGQKHGVFALVDRVKAVNVEWAA